MNASFDREFDTQFDSEVGDSKMFVGAALGSVDTGARSGVVNRTHRVVRQRAKVMQERRSQVRSLMVPLIICSLFLILGVIAVWSGLYQYQATEAAEAVQADVTALAATDANNQFVVVLLWFVPVSLALLAAIWFRRTRSDKRETVR